MLLSEAYQVSVKALLIESHVAAFLTEQPIVVLIGKSVVRNLKAMIMKKAKAHDVRREQAFPSAPIQPVLG